jgi:hypothetical protein
MDEIRPGSKTRETVLKTDELYSHDGLWLGPRGRDYGVVLPHPKPYQHANLYPDPNSSYWLAFLEMPKGSVLTIRGRYPYGRHIQFALYRSDPDRGGYTATGEKLVHHQIEPDPGSVNPFVPGTNRRAADRGYTIRIANTDVQAARPRARRRLGSVLLVRHRSGRPSRVTNPIRQLGVGRPFTGACQV